MMAESRGVPPQSRSLGLGQVIPLISPANHPDGTQENGLYTYIYIHTY